MSADFDKPDKPFIPVPNIKDIGGTYSRRPSGDSPPGSRPIPTGGGPVVIPPPKTDKGEDPPAAPTLGGDGLEI